MPALKVLVFRLPAVHAFTYYTQTLASQDSMIAAGANVTGVSVANVTVVQDGVHHDQASLARIGAAFATAL
jgi:hypothetical protein